MSELHTRESEADAAIRSSNNALKLRALRSAVWLSGAVVLMLIVNIWIGWYMTFFAGLLLALARRGASSSWLAFSAGAVSWGGPVLFMADPVQLAVFAKRIGGVFGLPGIAAGIAVVAVTFLLGGLLSVCGSWLIRALWYRSTMLSEGRGVSNER
jgi:hypothetical protein